MLLETNPDVVPFSRGTWLHHAAREGKLDIVRLLIARGLDVNALDGHGEQTPLARAATAGEIDVVRYLLNHGAVMETGASVSNPMFACIVGYGGIRDEPRERFVPVAKLLIERGIDLTACYVQQSMVDMDAAAFAYMWGREDIAELILKALYGHDERQLAGAWAETIEVALGNAYSRQKFRKWRYPPKRGRNAGQTPPPGEFWA